MARCPLAMAMSALKRGLKKTAISCSMSPSPIAGVIMLVYLDQSYGKFKSRFGDKFNRTHLRESIIEGTALRVRPIMMTVITTTAGLMPILWGHGTGSQVMKRIAAPMVGGMVSATILTLVVVPAIYGLWKGYKMPKESRPQKES